MTFELREHTADVAVAASGPTLGDTLAAAADGLAAAQCVDVPEGGERFDLRVAADSRERLLFDYLDRLVYRRDVDGVLPVDSHASVVAVPDGVDLDSDGSDETDDTGDEGEYRLEASARGVPLSAIDAREVKAVTYSEMRVERVADGWELYVVLDV